VTIIAALVVPWESFEPHSHWSRVAWVPFSTPPPVTARDLIFNVLLYVPFGYLFARLRVGGSWVVLTCLSGAVVLSCGTELLQVYSHGRFPSATDVVMNIAGAYVGLRLARRRP
jgi:glycopeptide antibiotics resistance protein